MRAFGYKPLLCMLACLCLKPVVEEDNKCPHQPEWCVPISSRIRKSLHFETKGKGEEGSFLPAQINTNNYKTNNSLVQHNRNPATMAVGSSSYAAPTRGRHSAGWSSRRSRMWRHRSPPRPDRAAEERLIIIIIIKYH